MGANPKRQLVDYETAAEILNSRGIPADCPICSHSEWLPFGQLANLIVGLPLMTTAGEALEAGGMRGTGNALAWICTNCGFIRLVAEDLLARFRDEGNEPT